MSLSGIVLVTGGAGFIGSHIAQGMMERGARVRVIDDLSTGHRENLEELGKDVDFREASLADEKALLSALEGVELVFHEAAIPSVPRSVANPVETHVACVDATFALLNAARSAGVRRVVYAASSSAYGDQPTLPKVEDMRPEPLSPYAAAKLVGEYYGVVSRFISALLSNERPVIYGDGEQSRDFTYIGDVVEANARAAETKAGVGRVINFARGERTTLNQLLEAVKVITSRTDVEAEYREPRKGDVRHSLADITRAREWLGYTPQVSLEEGLRHTIDWWKRSRFGAGLPAA